MNREYQVTIHYDVEANVSVEVIIPLTSTTKEKAEVIAHQKLIASLLEDRIEILSENGVIFIRNEMLDLYKFKLCMKRLPPPVDVTNLTEMEKLELLSDSSYMTTSDDYKEVDWDIKTAYERVHERYPSKVQFQLSSLAYSIQEIS